MTRITDLVAQARALTDQLERTSQPAKMLTLARQIEAVGEQLRLEAYRQTKARAASSPDQERTDS